ncbi:uncharacterized protein TM35_000191230 [Trypanosoma theileri]|uniref:DUF7883 domain-containing protein n=1 Tax=Trypanosoma theileri TaxID=67003 RepID=A0A1X0NUK6_9TRYP|nr:uncharacterized protein TM35_000191230 [Trypanosoma theileri]ORC87879.1 hypothetical protein TM35_000191230 [Trypanosoma theileri]
MRGLRRLPSLLLPSAARRFLTPGEDDALWANMRLVLRRHGALPLPRVSALLSDEVLELMPAVAGGLRRYVLDRPARFAVAVLPGGVTVVMLAAELRRAGENAGTIAHVLANIAVAPQQQMSIAQLFRAIPTLEQRKLGSERRLEALLLQHPSLVTVHDGIVRAAPTTYMSRKGILSPPPAPPPPSSLLGQQQQQQQHQGRIGREVKSLPEAPSIVGSLTDDPKLNKLLILLQKTVPFSHYIPLRSLLRMSRSSMCFSPGMPVEEILSELQRVPATSLDCRVIGEEMDDVFLRMVDAERRIFVNDESTIDIKYSVLRLGPLLLNAFRVYAAESPENRRKLQSGIAMADLKDILPSDLMKQLYLYETKQKDAACIFIFDRLRHLFDVNMNAYMVRPWEVLGEDGQPSSLTWQTTPVPVVLRHSLTALAEKPLSPEKFLASLPKNSREQMQLAYPTVEAFVANHSLYLLLKDGLVWTPYLAAASQGARVPSAGRTIVSGRHLTESAKAQMLMEALPKDHPVEWNRFRGHSTVRDLPFSVFSIKPDFFDKHREYFRVYEVLGCHKLIVGRRDGNPPPAHYLHSPCNSLADLVRQMALFSIGGAQESSIMNLLSKEARLMVRRYGTLEQIARQLPMWFHVQNERQEQGSAIISYIVTDTPSHEAHDKPQRGEE